MCFGIRDECSWGKVLKCEAAFGHRVPIFHVIENFFQGWRPFHHLGCCKRDDSCSLRLTCVAILIAELDTSFCHLIWVLVGRFCCCFSPNFLPVAHLHVMETLSTHLLCNMHYVFDTILRIFCDIFKTFKIFQFGQMFPQQLLMVACLMLSQAVLIWSIMLHMVTDFQYSSMVVSLLVLRASKAWLKAPWHKVPWNLFIMSWLRAWMRDAIFGGMRTTSMSGWAFLSS